MKTLLPILAGLAIGLGCVNGYHFVIGNVVNKVEVAKHEIVKYNAIPFMKRVKQYFYSGPDYKKIQGIQALDALHTKATINITAGGIGYSYVNLRMKSERGFGLDYDIVIYVSRADFVNGL